MELASVDATTQGDIPGHGLWSGGSGGDGEGGQCTLSWSRDRCDSLGVGLRVHEGETIYDFCWFPQMTAMDPLSCCFASSSRVSGVGRAGDMFEAGAVRDIADAAESTAVASAAEGLVKLVDMPSASVVKLVASVVKLVAMLSASVVKLVDAVCLSGGSGGDSGGGGGGAAAATAVVSSGRLFVHTGG